MEYDDDNNPVRVDTVVISVQHRAEASLDELRPYIIEKVIKTTIPEHLIDEHTRYLINPTGRFVIGGPQGCLLYTSWGACQLAEVSIISVATGCPDRTFMVKGVIS